MDSTRMLLLLPHFHLVLLVAVGIGLESWRNQRWTHRWLSVFFPYKWIFFTVPAPGQAVRLF